MGAAAIGRGNRGRSGKRQASLPLTAASFKSPPQPVLAIPHFETLPSTSPTTGATEQSRTTTLRSRPPLPLPDHDVEPAPRRGVAKTTVGSAAAGRTGKSEWAIKRYWSTRGSIPDYGTQLEGTNMHRLKKRLTSFHYVNRLNGSSPSQQSESSPTPAKRPSDSSLLAQPPKRPRHNAGVLDTDPIRLDGSSDVRELGSQSIDSNPRRSQRHDGSMSQHSSADALTRAPCIGELRDTQKYASGGKAKGRMRHKKPDRHSPASNGYSNQKRDSMDSQQTRSGPPFKQRRLISQMPGSIDVIEDGDEEDAQLRTMGGSARKTKTKETARYTALIFQPNMAGSISDDELAIEQHQPQLKMREQMTASTTSTTPQGRPANTKLKRHAEGIPDALRCEHSVKRRSKYASEADILRTSFLNTGDSSRNKKLTRRVATAVCLPNLIYPARDRMPSGAPGASNQECNLQLKPDSPRCFSPTSNLVTEIEELQWLVPEVHKMNTIAYDSTSNIVKVTKSNDTTAAVPSGAALYIEFKSTYEAADYVQCIKELVPSITYLSNDQLRREMIRKTEEVYEHNKRQSPASLTHPLAHYFDNHRKRRGLQSVDLMSPDLMQSVTPQRAKMSKAHNKAGGDPENMVSAKPTSQARTPQSRTEEERILEVVGSDCDDHAQTSRRTRSRQDVTLGQADEVFDLRSARSTRSTRLQPRSSTPPPLERWTNNNPDWVNQRNYKIPLIYERTTINATDIERLDEGQFLNDEIISFYAKYLHKQVEREERPDAKKVYVFNSFFWEKLRSSGHSGVKSWTTRVDLSTFDYIVVPINQSAHWYVAIICNPGDLLIGQDDAHKEDAHQEDGADHSAAVEKAGKADVSVQRNAIPKLDTVTESMSQVSIDDQADAPASIDPVTPAMTSSKKAKTSKRGPGPRKYDPKKARIIVLDSLGGSHSDVPTTLKKYLKEEFKDKRGVDIELPRDIGMTAKDIPIQNNFTDCGVYLLGYLEVFMQDPYGFTEKIMQHESRTWDVNAPDLRNKIRSIIFDLQSDYQKDMYHQRRARALRKQAQSQTPPAGSRPSTPISVNEQPAPNLTVMNSPMPSSRRQTPARLLPSAIPLRPGQGTDTSRRRIATLSPPPVQQKQTSPGRTKVAPGSVDESRQAVNGDLEIGDMSPNTVVNHNKCEDSRQAVHSQQQHSKISPDHANASHVVRSSSSSESGSDDMETNNSMLVECSRSFDTAQAQDAAKEAATPPARLVVKLVETVESDDLGNSGASKLSAPRSTSRQSEAPANLNGHVDDGERDERNFLKTLASSQSSSSPRRSSSAIPKAHSRRRSGHIQTVSAKKATRVTTPKQDATKSPYWKPGKNGSAKTESSPVTVIPSSEDESMGRYDKHKGDKKSKQGSKITSPNSYSSGKGKRATTSHIDLTED